MSSCMKKIELLRKKLLKENLDAFFISNKDIFQNIHNVPILNPLLWLCGFSGSYGILIITMEKVFLLTDGRYLEQAEFEINGIEKLKCKIINIGENKQTLLEQLKDLRSIQSMGYDPTLNTVMQTKSIQQILGLIPKQMMPKSLHLLGEDLLNLHNYDEDLYLLPDQYRAETIDQKIEKLIRYFNTIDNTPDYTLITSTESLSWLFNIRVKEKKHNPAISGYALLNVKNSHLIIYTPYPEKLKKSLSKLKTNLNIKIKNFNEVYKEFSKIAERGQKITIDPYTAPIWFFNVLQEKQTPTVQNSFMQNDPILPIKARKTNEELEGMHNAHIVDGIAWCKFLAWLESQLHLSEVENETLDEISLAEQMLHLKKENKNFVYPSFETISAIEANASIIHYQPTQKTNKSLYCPSTKQIKNCLYLCDSGGQYKYGTTDITRTIATNTNPNVFSIECKERYTNVLCGHIALASLKFPLGTTGAQLDGIARQYLWRNQKDYDHGTGHGVGFCLNVHEGPQSINKKDNTTLEPNMVISIEPGFYKKGEYGIRIENLYVIKLCKNNKFLEFQPLTLVPIDTALILNNMMPTQYQYWLEKYHGLVCTKLKNFLCSETKKILNRRYRMNFE
jgi:Xaa-Pro aminopeptidase